VVGLRRRLRASAVSPFGLITAITAKWVAVVASGSRNLVVWPAIVGFIVASGRGNLVVWPAIVGLVSTSDVRLVPVSSPILSFNRVAHRQSLVTEATPRSSGQSSARVLPPPELVLQVVPILPCLALLRRLVRVGISMLAARVRIVSLV
jgi:hypothetical protein